MLPTVLTLTAVMVSSTLVVSLSITYTLLRLRPAMAAALHRDDDRVEEEAAKDEAEEAPIVSCAVEGDMKPV